MEIETLGAQTSGSSGAGPDGTAQTSDSGEQDQTAEHTPLTRAEQDQEVKCRPLETLCLWTGAGAGTCWTAADPT